MKIYGQHDAATIAQLETCLAGEDGAVGVLCADGHLGYSMPIGGVVGYERHVSPSGVGYDIACGNMAIQTDAKRADLNIKAVMDDVWRTIAFGVGRKNPAPVDSPVLDKIGQSPCAFQRGLQQMAAQQLGTVGSGNHYVDLFEDEADGSIWIGVHFGSRGFGHKTATWALEQAGSHRDDMHAPPTLIQVDSALGADYIAGMQLAGEYAYAGREAVVECVRKILGAKEVQRVHNHHNFAWLEQHGERKLWVHRKGATPAFPGQRGFVGSTMGEVSVILEGVDGDWSAEALNSTVHGAGRAMSRTQAAGKRKRGKQWTCGNYRTCDFKAAAGDFRKEENQPAPPCPKCNGKLQLSYFSDLVKPGLIDFEATKADLVTKGIELRGAGADEAPGAYKRLSDVLAEHAGTVNILYRLRPIGVAMAGIDEFDPYKD